MPPDSFVPALVPYDTRDVLTWKPQKPIEAKTVRILTTANGPPPSWVAWEGVSMFSC